MGPRPVGQPLQVLPVETDAVEVGLSRIFLGAQEEDGLALFVPELNPPDRPVAGGDETLLAVLVDIENVPPSVLIADQEEASVGEGNQILFAQELDPALLLFLVDPLQSAVRQGVTVNLEPILSVVHPLEEKAFPPLLPEGEGHEVPLALGNVDPSHLSREGVGDSQGHLRVGVAGLGVTLPFQVAVVPLGVEEGKDGNLALVETEEGDLPAVGAPPVGPVTAPPAENLLVVDPGGVPVENLFTPVLGDL
ncbi:MAG: hypothetical protein BWY86_00724 [Candidatus Aminicenantes bacterium ADurb.Bin508]|nr:MAG: hypothetical protein BWY86_00724 [Candidatus Aminicenantes bacterium ADurb.Bin508]